MNTRLFSIIALITTIGAGILYIVINTNSSNNSLPQNLIPEKSDEKLRDNLKNKITKDVSVEHIDYAEDKSEPIDKTEGYFETKRYEEDWCSVLLDLHKDDLDFATSERADWDLSRGAINFKYVRDDDVRSFSKIDVIVSQYSQKTYSELINLLKVDDELAAMAVLTREELSRDKKNKIAKALLLRGKTGNALQHLVHSLAGNMSTSASLGKDITAEQKQDFLDAIAYASYGIERYDMGGVSVLLIHLESIENTVTLGDVFSTQELNTVTERVEAISKSINDTREKLNLGSLDQIDIPKIAKREFEFELMLAYRENSDLINTLKGVNDSLNSTLEATECIQNQLTHLTQVINKINKTPKLTRHPSQNTSSI